MRAGSERVLEAVEATVRDLVPFRVEYRIHRKDGSLAWIRDHPGRWLRLLWVKARNFWGAYEVPDNLDYYLYRGDAPVLRLPLATFGLVAPLALAGAWLLRRRPGWPGRRPSPRCAPGRTPAPTASARRSCSRDT